MNTIPNPSRWAAALLLVLAAMPAAADPDWEYQVAVVQGITAGGTVERRASGYYVDTKRTSILNELAANGWEVVAVLGGPATDHSVYLRRARRD